MLVIPINYVVAQSPCYGGCGGGVGPSLVQTLEQARAPMLSQQVKQLEEQHTQDLQIMVLLVSIIAGLVSVVVVLSVGFLKNRNLKTKPSPETERREDQ